MTLPRPGLPGDRTSPALLTGERARMLGLFLDEISDATRHTGWAFRSTIVTIGSGESEAIVAVRWEEDLSAYVAEIR